MTFSDFYIVPSRKAKIEILPGDFLDQRVGIIEQNDRLITVYRPVEDPFVAKRLHDEFWEEFSYRLKTDGLNLVQTLRETVKAFNFSCLNPPSDFVPESGAMVLLVYISSGNEFTFVQVGPITLKTRQNGRFVAVTESHMSKGEPTRFIGHPSYCSVDETSSISSSPYSKTLVLE